MNGFQKTFRRLGRFVSKHSPEILTGLGIAGMVSATVASIKATPKAMAEIEAKKEELEMSADEKLPVKEVIKSTWKYYIPTVSLITVSTACLIGSTTANNKQKAALATAYTLSETALKDYQEKVTEELGDKKAQKIRDAISKDKIENNPVTSNEIIITGNGNVLCYEPISEKYFESNIEHIKYVQNKLNKNMFSDMYTSLNDFLYELGLDSKFGCDLGWNVNRGLIDISFSTQLSPDNRPCLVINYITMPEYNYQDY